MKISSLFYLNKRKKIIASAIIISLGLLSTQLVPFYLTYRFIGGLAALSAALTVWSLWEGLNKFKGLVLMILPVFFTIAVSSFYFLLPGRWLTRIPVAVLFGLIFYTMMLSQNVFNIASVRTIPLYRVASTTIFVLTLITAFLLFNVIFSLNLSYFYNGLVVFILSLPLILQMIWSIEMGEPNLFLIFASLTLSLVMGEVAMALSFWPLSKPMISLLLATVLYVVLGISTFSLRDRLSKNVVYECLAEGSLVFIIAYLTTSWNG